MAAIWFLAGLILFLVTLPGTLELVIVTLPGLLARRPIQSGQQAVTDTRLAVVVPAHDEEQGLPATLESLLTADQAPNPQDIYVIADNCSDHTADVAGSCGVSVLERTDPVKRGKGHALNWAFTQLLEKDYTAFINVDADTRVAPNFFAEYRRFFAAGGEAAQSAYYVGNPEVNLRTRLQYIAFLAFNFLRPLSRRNLGLSAGILGNGFGLSAQTLREIPYDSFSIVEDLEYHARLVRAGKRVAFLAETSVCSDMPTTAEEAQSQRERWEGGRFRMIAEQTPRLLRGLFLEGRLRLLEPLLELWLLPLSYHVLLLVILAIFGFGTFFGAYALFGLFMLVLHILMAMFVGNATAADWKALASAPFFILWKLTRLGGIVKTASKGASWKRTSRGS
ncbi:MAG: glycosyltransferase family 2 protein [Thiotrichales bacterium]